MQHAMKTYPVLN